MFLIVFLLSVSLVNAAVSKDYGYVKLNKLNIEPEVSDVSFSSELFAGEVVSCDAQVDDENPESVELKTDWYVNNVLVFEGVEFSGFKKGDLVECLVTPTDAQGFVGTAQGISLEAKAAPFSLTGFVVSDAGKGGGAVGLMVGLVGLFIIKRKRIAKLF